MNFSKTEHCIYLLYLILYIVLYIMSCLDLILTVAVIAKFCVELPRGLLIFPFDAKFQVSFANSLISIDTD